jgi:hypothetical protein
MLDRTWRTGPLDADALPKGGCRGDAADVLRGRLELEATASEVQDATLHGAPPDRLRKRVEACAALFLDFEQTGFTQDTQMFRHVVGRDAESLRNLADVERFVDQQTHDPDPGVLAEGAEGHDAVVPVNDGNCAVTWGKTIELNGLIKRAALCHGATKIKIAQTFV